MDVAKPQAPPNSCWQSAADYGIDMSQLEYLLTITPAERLERHEHARQLVLTLREAGKKLYGFDPQHPWPTCSRTP